MDERLLTPGALVSYVFWGLLLLGLFLTSRYSYLLFHSIAGFFSTVIATGVFAIAWNARRFQENNYLTVQNHCALQAVTPRLSWLYI